MAQYGWIRGPFGLDASRGATLPWERTVLVVAHDVTTLTRLIDVVQLVEEDPRVQVVYAPGAPSVFSRGVEEHLHRLGGLVIPWEQATQLSFDLAIVAGHGFIDQLHAPILSVPHGIGPGKMLRRVSGQGPPARRQVAGMAAQFLVFGGRVIPSCIALGHERHLRVLERECPEATPAATVVGDPCLDRMMASTPLRERYRAALGAGPDHEVVLVTSTWGEGSLLGQRPDVLHRITAELSPTRYRVVAVLHPQIWAWYGRRTIVQRHARCLRQGMRLIPPEEGWQAAVVAADRVVGDHGSVAYYAAAMGAPLILGAFPEDDIVPGSHVARLGVVAPRLDLTRPLSDQLDEAAHAYGDETHAALLAEITSEPGRAARHLRREIYRLVRLPEPDDPPAVDPVPPPVPIRGEGAEAA